MHVWQCDDDIPVPRPTGAHSVRKFPTGPERILLREKGDSMTESVLEGPVKDSWRAEDESFSIEGPPVERPFSI